MGQENSDLKREVGFFSATMVVVASMVGTGIFTTSGFIMAELSSPYSMLICWLLGGMFAICGALCYAELGAMYPAAGGEYVFLRESFGKCIGFLSGWVSLIIGFSAPVAASSLAFAAYFSRSFSVSLGPELSLSLFGIEVVTLTFQSVLAISVIVVFSLVHCHSLSAGERVQNGLTLFKIGFIVSFVLLGLLLGDGSIEDVIENSDMSRLTQGEFAISLIFVSFAYSGWNAAAYLGGEIKSPRRNIPLALILGTLLVMTLYLLLNIVYIYALPSKDMSGVLEVGIRSAASLFGDNIGKYFGGAISLCILSVVSALVMTGPRVYYAMAKDGLFFSIFAKLSRTYGIPRYAIFLQAIIAVVMVMTASFDRLVLYIGFTLSIFTMLTVVGVIVLRKKKRTLQRSYKTFGYPLTPMFFIIGNLWIVYYSIKTRPVASLIGLSTIFVGLLFYLYFNWRLKKIEE